MVISHVVHKLHVDLRWFLGWWLRCPVVPLNDTITLESYKIITIVYNNFEIIISDQKKNQK